MKFFETYTSLAKDRRLLSAMEEQGTSFSQYMLSIAESDATTIHAPYRWTIRQVFAHIVDTERVFGARALHCLRCDDKVLPGFDQTEYASVELQAKRSVDVLARDFTLLRESHMLLLRSVPDSAWSQSCEASGVIWTLDDIARSMLGHVRYHEKIVNQRLANTDYG